MIEFRQVTKKYHGPNPAVENFSAIIPNASITVLLGSSGCGKTTLMRMVNRMVDPTSGQVLIDGQDVADSSPVLLRRSIGYVMQNAGLMPHRKVVDNIATVPVLKGIPKATARKQAKELMDRVGLDAQLADRYPHQLSGGQAQRVGVARALAAEPNILLMDEPFGAVDPLVRSELQEEMLRLQAEFAKTVLFVTHDVDEALLLGDQIILLTEGAQIAQIGPGSEFLSNPANDFVRQFLGLDEGGRSLQVDEGVVVDRHGRPVGAIAENGAP